MMKFLFSLVFCIIVSIQSFPQNSFANKNHPLSGTFGVSLEGGATYTFSDLKKDGINIYGRVLLEYIFRATQVGAIGLRGYSGGGYLTGSDGATDTRPELDKLKTQIFIFGGGVEYLFTFSKFFVPYVYGGAALLYFDPNDDNGNRLTRNASNTYSRTELVINGELGMRLLASEKISVNLGVNINSVQSDNLDDVIAGTNNDFFIAGFGGITFYFGGTRDSDGDGVNDNKDACPETPFGIAVDQFGCAIDSDNDGIPDYLDRCNNTPANIKVDEYGCPLDTDLDGVHDYLDMCANTPPNISVNKEGCPLDTDKDGVPDYMDNCADTPAGTEVDKWGCPVKKESADLPEATRFTLTGGVNFAIAKSDLLPQARIELNKIFSVMIEHPETRWVIAGHTDNTGAYAFNKQLSYKRATSVAIYFINNGIESNRLVVVGVGPDDPVADNSTEYGRAMNRRVTIELTDKDTKTTRRFVPSNYNTFIERNMGQMIFTDGNLFCFQIAAFRTRKKAENEAAQLLDDGENAFIVESYIPELKATWYRVRIGFFKTINEVREYRKRFVR